MIGRSDLYWMIRSSISILDVVASILALGVACLDLFFHLIRYFENDKLPSFWCMDIFDLFMHWVYRFNL
ncbi:hypothetical protein EBA29_02541 [Bacillus velezensis]|nr:hypothetical protein EBA29_02541 [Bacillus velezensis]